MTANIKFREVDLVYKVYGNKTHESIVLLHGYLESMQVWNSFADELSKKYFVVSIDLPGHGRSGIYSRVHRMDDMADAVLAVIDELKIKKVHLVGHSMGGYVALAFRESHQDRLYSCTLFHSGCFADDADKIAKRDEDVRMVEEGNKQILIERHVPLTFAKENQDSFAADIFRLKEMALKTPDEGIIAVLNGMKKRHDRCILLKDELIPFLIIAGKKDNFIPLEVSRKIASMGSNIKLEVLENSGHIGFIEEKEESLQILDNFFKNISHGKKEI